MSDADRCVCCGEIIPEGRQVCPQCEGGVEKAKKEEAKNENNSYAARDSQQ